MSGKRFTKSEERLLEERYGEGAVDCVALGEELGRDSQAIRSKAWRMGLSDLHRPKTEKHKEVLSKRSKEAMNGWGDPNSWMHSEENKQRLSDLMLTRTIEMHQRGEKWEKGCGTGNRGKREDLESIYFQSSWEANYARYLNFLVSTGEIEGWEYEPDLFVFGEIKRGARSYLPDFKVYHVDGRIEYYEVKGRMFPKSKLKFKYMAKYYPDVKEKLIDRDAYRAIKQRMSSVINTWEEDFVSTEEGRW